MRTEGMGPGFSSSSEGRGPLRLRKNSLRRTGGLNPGTLSLTTLGKLGYGLPLTGKKSGGRANYHGSRVPLVLRRKHRVMAEKETELNVAEPLEIASGAAAEEPDNAADPGPAAAPADIEAPVGPGEPVSRAEFEQLKAERDELLDRLGRLQAEFENARKRAERERIGDRDYAAASVVEKFLPVVDNFQLALKSHGTAQQMRHGIELIVKQMEEVLRQMQVIPIPAVGEPFDPRLHEALGAVDRDDLPDQHVAEEVRRGYRLRERLLRPALVRIVHNPKQTAE